MKTLKRSKCSILPLVLKGKWYDMIDSGVKKAEYREVKPYWEKRIRKWLHKGHESDFSNEWDFPALVVTFSRGYKKPGMAFLVECCEHLVGWERSNLKTDWGEPAIPHYRIWLGERVNLED